MELPECELSKQPTKGKQQAECSALLTASCWLTGLLVDLKMEAVSSPKMVNFKQTTLYHSPEEIESFCCMVCSSFFSEDGNLQPKETCREISSIVQN
jgi:hypothetical protein